LNKQHSLALKTLRWILGTYIILCIGIATLKYAYGPSASLSFQEGITWFWHFYENWIKTFFIIICSILTLKIIAQSKKRSTMHKRNLIGLIIIALLVHIILPICLDNKELYVYAMPFPWTTAPLQHLYEAQSMAQSPNTTFTILGIAGISASFVFYLSINLFIFIGTLLFGRRLQCSTLCLFNGFASEVFGIGMPLIGKRKKVGSKALKGLTMLRWVFLMITLFFGFWWLLKLCGIHLFGELNTIDKLETIKYLGAELLMALFFWVAFFDRVYCYYCPVGTILGLISKLAGQKITTDRTHCVSCNQCNIACPMTIDIASNAKEGLPVQNLRCVGCGHCIDACPTQNLSYSTHFLDCISKNSTHSNQSHSTKL